MSYTKGQRVRHVHGRLTGSVLRDTPDHAVVWVKWDGEDIPRSYFPECIVPEGMKQASVRDAWLRGETRLKASTV